MKNDDEHTLLNWLGFANTPNFRAAKGLGPVLGVLLGLILLITLIAGGALLIWLSGLALSFDNDNSEAARNVALTAAALFGAPFIVWQVWLAQRRADNADEGLITDRINAAVASLGADKDVKTEEGEETRPNIAVRVGAILALERLAKQNDDVHCQIMEILCAYLREETSGNAEYKNKHAKKPREDIQLALTVIGRRSERQIAFEPAGLIDLRNTHLFNAVLRGARLPTALLYGANLQEAHLRHANLQHADLRYANLQHAHLEDAKLQHADLRYANLQEAYLVDANLQEANLSHANLQVLNFLTHALLHGACVKNFDFTDVTIGQGQVDEMFGDASVILPDPLVRPTFWPHVELDGFGFAFEWEKWKRAPETYRFDPTLYGDKYTKDVGD